ncbi:MAG: HemK family protein methyltransferase, partial [Actinomycetota bacterium]|nr:HemK family protein methyltransferase [Actinomycetota bacterium]
MRPAEVARRGAAYLERHGVASSNAESEALLQRILGIDRAALFTRDTGLSTAEAKVFGRALCRRCTGVPLQHLTGEQGFRNLVLEVRPGVFVPRPETEVLVEVALGLVAVPEPLVVDLCTGSGAVALAIASELPGSRVYATDLSTDAVTLARANAGRLDLEVTIVQGHL